METATTQQAPPAPATRIEPDLEFVREVKARGGETLKNCFQCATCSVTCSLSPAERPFPRKEMIWAQWGLKDRLAADPDLWLCFQCNDCSKRCPRGAKPGDVLAALRQLAIQENARPRFLARMFGEPRFLPLVFGAPIVILSLGLLVARLVSGWPLFPTGSRFLHYDHFMPMLAVDVIFIATSLLVTGFALDGVRRAWRGWSAGPGGAAWPGLGAFVAQAIPAAVEILTHRRFADCEARRDRRWPHFGLLWSFIALFAVTGMVFLGVYVFHQKTPYSITGNPIKWLANLGALALIVSALVVLWQRLFPDEDAGRYSYFDWLFLLVVLGTGLTGLGCEVLRVGTDRVLSGLAPLAYLTYFAHLVLVWVLFVMLPFSKFAHLAYRTAALIHARLAGRDQRPAAAA